MPSLEVRLFGGLELRHAGERLPPLPSRAARSLLAYLVLHRHGPHLREQLADRFWPDLPPGRARRRLSHTLWQLQDVLGELPATAGVLVATSDTIGIDPDAEARIDVEEFDRRLEALRSRRHEGRADPRDLVELEAVVALYRGEVLPGHTESWAQAAQERYEQRYLEALTWLVRLATAQGLYPDALLYARRLANLDPLREDAHREVMRLYMLQGRSEEAIRQFERCREVLAEELGTEPAAATVQLHARIVRQRRHAASEPAVPGVGPAFPEQLPLLGRERERGTVLHVLERALAGRGGVAFIEADPGLGKSRLLTEVADDARWRGFEVLGTSCLGPEPGRAYDAITDLLDAGLTPVRIEQLRHRLAPVWRDEAARLAPAIAPHAAPLPAAPAGTREHADAQQRLQDAVVEVLLALAATDPLLVVVDDVHWADEQTLRVLTRLAARSRDARVVIVAAFRGEDARARSDGWRELRELDRVAQPTRVTLGALDAFSTAELLRLTLAGRRDVTLDASRLHEDTGGNPLLVIETLRELVEHAEVPGLDSRQLPISERIRQLLLARLSRLPPEARQVAEVAALAGEGAGLQLLTATTQLPRLVVVDAVDQLLRASLLRSAGEGYALHHDQLRRVTISTIDPRAQQAWHRHLGDALMTQDPPPVERIAHHLSTAGDHARAVPWLRAAAEQAVEVHAYELADRHLLRARDGLSRAPASAGLRTAVLTAHAEVLDVLGEPQRLSTTLHELAPLVADDPGAAIDLRRRRAQLLARRGELPEAIALAQDTADAARDHDDVELLAAVLVVLGTALVWAGETDRATRVLREAAASTASDRIRVEAGCHLGTLLRELQRYGQASSHLEASLALADRMDDPRAQAQVLGVLGSVEMETGAPERAAERYEQAIAHAGRTGERGAEARHRMNLANVRHAQGRYADALEGYEAARRGFELVADRRGRAIAHLNLANLRHQVLGRDTEAEQDLGVVLAFADEVDAALLRAMAYDLRARLHLRRGRRVRAHDDLERGLVAAEEARSALARVHLLQARCEAALAQPSSSSASAVPARHLDAALADAERAHDTAVEHHLRDLEVGTLTTLVRVRLAAGDPPGAARAAEQLADLLEQRRTAGFLARHAIAQAAAASGDARAADRELRHAREELRVALAGLPDDLRATAEQVPAHTAILHGRLPGLALVEVAARYAPTGRPLTAEERVTVAVSLARHPEDPDDPVLARRTLLRRVSTQIIEGGGAATVADLAELLSVSEATVRRDLRELRRDGAAVTTRGTRAG